MIPIMKPLTVLSMEIEREDPITFIDHFASIGGMQPVYSRSSRTTMKIVTPSLDDPSILYADFFVVANPRLQRHPVSLGNPTGEHDEKVQQLNTFLEILQFARTNPVAREKLEDLFKLRQLLG